MMQIRNLTIRTSLRVAVIGTLSLVAGGVSGQGTLPVFAPDGLIAHIRTLASDEYEGRAPASRGEDLTVDYLVAQFKSLGLRPGNPDGSYIQPVPLVSLIPDPSMTLETRTGNSVSSARFRDDFVAWTRRVSETVSVTDADMVFVGYGAVAPEYGWDDYKGVDLKGKFLVMLVGDPPVPDPNAPGQLDPKTFGGRAMTYYGRWTYKFDIAAEKQAAGAIIVHETEPAGYPFSVVQGMGGERFGLVTADKGNGLAAVEGWMSSELARSLFARAGRNYDELKRSAASRTFAPVSLGTTASVTVRSTIRAVNSRNVVARLDGSDPVLRNEFVIYSAHWDHLGVGTPVNGDRIYNGAQDNASGTAALLEIARAFAAARPAPKRSILFLADTAEEQGLLGTEHYGAAPLYPLERTLAVINMDSMNVRGRTSDMTVIGLGLSELDDYVAEAVKAQERHIAGDPEPETGRYYRSDHFPFAKRGVPSLNAGGGSLFVGRPAGYAEAVRREYTDQRYHRPSDEYESSWDLSGLIEDMQVLFQVGRRVSDAERFPAWKDGAEFKATRERMLAERRP